MDLPGPFMPKEPNLTKVRKKMVALSSDSRDSRELFFKKVHLRGRHRRQYGGSSSPYHHSPAPLRSSGMNAIAGLAALLLVIWLVLRIALAVTSGVLHLLWIAAVIMMVIWLVGKLRGSKT